MGARARRHDWHPSGLGPPDSWPQSLKTIVQLMFNSRYPMFAWWGPRLINFYNDAYIPVLGRRHPEALGQPAAEVWSDIWDTVGQQASAVMDQAQASWSEEQLLLMERHGFLEETYFTYSYSPIPGDDGGVAGVFCACTEDTQRVLDRRRLRTLRALAEKAAEGKTVEEACALALLTLEENPHDLPFALIYLLDGDGRRATLAGSCGFAGDPPSTAAPPTIDLADAADPWSLRTVAEKRLPLEVEELTARLGPLPGGAWPESPSRAFVVPLERPGTQPLAGFVVAGISPRRPYDDGYRGFLDLLARHLATAVGNARTYAEERRRAEHLEQLDHAKTTFFSNVSHEFRTPLTLMLGPVAELLEREAEALDPEARALLSLVRGNGRRLQKLVNTLLDFSRIEAGRLRAVFQPTDLAAFTAELASNFQSACERAGLTLQVDCKTLPEPVLVDRAMWEKIVLNLLSNAFKFTFEGRIEVTLEAIGGVVQLTVSDTGTGIPEAEMPRLFERFYQVAGARGRSQEGSGIGLALVQELVRQLGGEVEAESAPGRGTVFRVRLPHGSRHLPPDQIQHEATTPFTSTAAELFVEEALRWMPEDADSAMESPAAPAGGADRPAVLVADDNPEMLAYLTRLLEPRFAVTALRDGKEALEAARAEPPELILSDVMMPELDGFGLLEALRADPSLRALPVILLSARAGEEARIEGLAAGADDYLTKPFSARELLARVESHIAVARVRRETEATLHASRQQLQRLVDHAPVGIAVLRGEDLVFHSANPVFQAIRGPAVSLVGRTYREAFPEAADAGAEAALRKVLTTGERWRLEDFPTLIPGRTGLTWWDGECLPLYDAEGRIDAVMAIVWEVTERRRASQALRRSEERFRALFESIAAGFCIIEMIHDESGEAVDYRFLEVNPAFARQTGIDQAVGRRMREIAPEHESHWFEIYGRVARTREPVSYENFARELGRYFEGYAFPVGSAEERQVGVLFYDVTEERATEAALRESEARFRATFDNAAVGMAHLDLEGRWLRVNDRLCAILRCSRETLLGKKFHDITYPEHLVDDEVHLRALVEGRRTASSFEKRYRTGDGALVWTHVSVSVLHGESGEPLHLVAIIQDVHARKEAEAALRESEERFRNMADNAPVMIWLTDREGACTYLNKGWYRFTGQPEGTGMGQEWLNALHPDDYARAGEEFQAAGHERRTVRIEYRLKRHDGAYRWAIDTASPRFSSEGDFLGYIGSVIDVSDLKEVESRLREADRRKDEFLATLAHELRNPLAPIRTGLEILKLSEDDPAEREEIRVMMEEQTEQLITLVDDLLEVSRITRGKLELRKQTVTLAEVVKRAIDGARPVIDEAGHALAVNLPAEAVKLVADPHRLAQVFSNLLNNAAKYTPKGGHIEFRAWLEDETIVIEVEDNGIGIRREHLAGIFEMFTQLDNGKAHAYSGLGIGLTLARTLVTMHGGEISVSSPGPGRGSTFSIRLPARSAAPPATAAPLAAPPAERGGCRVLVVDDNESALIVLSLLVRKLGHEVRTAQNGREALEVADSFRPRVILMDIGMPEMDGYEAARQMGDAPWREDVLLVALTGWGQEEDRQRTLEAGFDRHLVKPAGRKDLEAIFASLAPPAS